MDIQNSSPDDLLLSLSHVLSGMRLAEFLKKHPDIPRRTIQRWLAELVQASKVVIHGEGRARRYFINLSSLSIQNTQINTQMNTQKNQENIPLDLEVQKSDEFPHYIPVSPDSRDILSYLKLPQNARRPVGYDMSFLEGYQPNQTYYLSETLRQQLRQMGNTGGIGLPAGTYSRSILSRLLIDLSWASSHLEGNTYSLSDTYALIEHGKMAEGKALMETQMILNHKNAIELLVENADNIGFNRYTLMNVHAALSENLLPNPLDEGRIREHAVEIGRSVFKPLSIPMQLMEQLDQLLQKAAEIKDPFEQSFFAMVHLPYLQAFADVNKRTSRLMANLPLIRANLCPLTFLDVPETAYSRATLGVYELNRIELLRDLYLWAYERSTQKYLVIKQELVEPDPIRLKYREKIREVIYQVITHPDQDALDVIKTFSCQFPKLEEDVFKAFVIEEIRRLHEGVLARYKLKLSEFLRWKETQKLLP